MAETSLRLMTVLRQLPHEPNFITVKELQKKLESAGYEISIRTIQRDLNTLSAEYPLITEKKGRGVGWAYSKHSPNNAFPGMNAVTALTIKMAMEHLNTLLPTQVLEHLTPWQKEAERKLSRQYKNWLDKVRVVNQNVLLPPQIDPNILALIYQALLENKRISATYKGKPERIIHPYGLVQQEHSLYLICRFYDFDDVRITALQRFDSVEVLDESVRPFRKFNIDQYLNQGGLKWPVSDERISLTVKATDYVANLLQETPLSHEQTAQQQDESVIVTAKVLDTMQLRRWILSHISDIEVLAPTELRQWLKATAADMLSKHEDN